MPIGEEIGTKRTFVWAIDWPGWSRGGRSPELAREALLAAGHRYARVAAVAGLTIPALDGMVLETVEAIEGSASTDFGVPGSVGPLDRRPLDADEAARQGALVEAAWSVLAQIAALAPASLRKGPRGGGRDRDAIVRHVAEAEGAYAGVMGVKLPAPDPDRPETVATVRRAILDILSSPSDGSPIGGRKWPARYAARRVAWHALDHAWEIEDRSAPA